MAYANEFDRFRKIGEQIQAVVAAMPAASPTFTSALGPVGHEMLEAQLRSIAEQATAFESVQRQIARQAAAFKLVDGRLPQGMHEVTRAVAESSSLHAVLKRQSEWAMSVRNTSRHTDAPTAEWVTNLREGASTLRDLVLVAQERSLASADVLSTASESVAEAVERLAPRLTDRQHSTLLTTIAILITIVLFIIGSQTSDTAAEHTDERLNTLETALHNHTDEEAEAAAVRGTILNSVEELLQAVRELQDGADGAGE